MDYRVRDLDQIQEQDGDEHARRLGTILMAAAAIVGLSLALGVVVGRAAEPAASVEDPLAKLERSTTATTSAEAPKPAAQVEPQTPKVEAAELSFPAALAEDEERPEVLAALTAAKAEAAGLVTPEANANAPAAPADVQAPAAAAAPAPAAASNRGDDDADDDSDVSDRPAPSKQSDMAKASVEIAMGAMVSNIPAAVAAGVGAHNLRQAAKHDPLVAAAVHPSAQQKPTAPEGRDGEYTLQVISYDRPEASRAFAEGLRAKGHMAFVVSADVPERGRYYRVRVGPFKNRELAEAYRHKFEEQEHMNTFVVHDKERQPSPPAP
jgi:cell division septation protein DedD